MGKIMLLSRRAVCGNKYLNSSKSKKPSGLLSQLGIETPLRKSPVLVDILF